MTALGPEAVIQSIRTVRLRMTAFGHKRPFAGTPFFNHVCDVFLLGIVWCAWERYHRLLNHRLSSAVKNGNSCQHWQTCVGWKHINGRLSECQKNLSHYWFPALKSAGIFFHST